jgi:hypothetical protein
LRGGIKRWVLGWICLISEALLYWLLQVHFAATKDGLSQHFNKFGEVLKVIIVTDAATGQPKG